MENKIETPANVDSESTSDSVDYNNIITESFDDLNIKSLVDRLKNDKITELIIATNSTTEGQITGQYLAELCLGHGVLITKLAQGIPIGGELDLLDYNTLSTAFSSRLEIKKTI